MFGKGTNQLRGCAPSMSITMDAMQIPSSVVCLVFLTSSCVTPPVRTLCRRSSSYSRRPGGGFTAFIAFVQCVHCIACILPDTDGRMGCGQLTHGVWAVQHGPLQVSDIPPSAALAKRLPERMQAQWAGGHRYGLGYRGVRGKLQHSRTFAQGIATHRTPSAVTRSSRRA